MVNRWMFGLAAGLLAASAAAQDKLRIEPPPFWPGGWTQVSERVGAGWQLSVFKPANAPASPQDLITLAVTRGESQKNGIARALGAWGTKIEATCPNVTVVPPAKPTTERGFSVGYGQFYCPKRTDKDEGTADFVKVIVWGTTAYMVAISHTTPTFTVAGPGRMQYEDSADSDALVEWLKNTSEYLLTIHACAGPPLESKCSPP
jgi:hypothetical protein